MLRWRCPNNFMGYCAEKPWWKHISSYKYYNGLSEGACALDPKTCGFYLTSGDITLRSILCAKES